MMNNDIICMIRSDGKIDVFLAIEDRMPANPFKELRAFFPQRQYKDAFYLKDRNEKLIPNGTLMTALLWGFGVILIILKIMRK